MSFNYFKNPLLPICKYGLLLFLFVTILSQLSFGNARSNELIIPKYSSMYDLYASLDSAKLTSNDEEVIVSYLTEKNIEIKEYLVQKYPEKRFEELDVNDASTFIVGLMTAMAEENNFHHIDLENSQSPGGENSSKFINLSSSKKIPDWIPCAMTTISAMFDIVGLYNEYVTLFTGSASWSGVASIVGKTLKRHFGWIAAAYLVYEISTNCF